MSDIKEKPHIFEREINAIIQTVARHYDVEVSTILDHQRGRPTEGKDAQAQAKAEILYLCRVLLPMSIADITDYFGYKSDGAVMRMFSRVARLRASNVRYRSEFLDTVVDAVFCIQGT